MKEVEEKFCQIYLATRDEVKAIMEAYGKMDLGEARDQAQYLLQRSDIKKFIQDGMIGQVGAESMASDIEEAFGKVAKEAILKGDLANANRALENLAKAKGMFVDKKEIRSTTIRDEEDLDAAIERLSNVVRIPRKA